MRRFHFNRAEDESGISGTGVVAEGVMFANGWCVVYWLTIHKSVTLYQSYAEMKEVHGHEGRTEIVWDDPEEEVVPEKVPEKPKSSSKKTKTSKG
jgi:hypothetical protein